MAKDSVHIAGTIRSQCYQDSILETDAGLPSAPPSHGRSFPRAREDRLRDFAMAPRETRLPITSGAIISTWYDGLA